MRGVWLVAATMLLTGCSEFFAHPPEVRISNQTDATQRGHVGIVVIEAEHETFNESARFDIGPGGRSEAIGDAANHPGDLTIKVSLENGTTTSRTWYEAKNRGCENYFAVALKAEGVSIWAACAD